MINVNHRISFRFVVDSHGGSIMNKKNLLHDKMPTKSNLILYRALGHQA